jgi:hypothetical protein
LAGQLRLFYVFSNATQLILVFPKKKSYLVSVSSIDSSGGGAIELRVEVVSSRNIFEKLKTRFQVTRQEMESNKCCFSIPADLPEQDKFTFWVFPPAPINDSTDYVTQWNYPEGKNDDDAIGSCVSFVYSLAKREFVTDVEAKRKKMMADAD